MSDILEYIKESVDRIENKLDKHDDRIIGVERWQSDAQGKVTMLASVSAVIGGIVVWISDLFHK